MSEVIPVRMKERTVSEIDKIQQMTHAASRSDAIRRAIEISGILIDAVSHGDRIVIETKEGKKYQLIIQGLIQKNGEVKVDAPE